MSVDYLRCILAATIIAISAEVIQATNEGTEVSITRRHRRQFGCGPQCGYAGCCGYVCCAPPPLPPPLPPPTPCCAPAPLPPPVPCCAPAPLPPPIPPPLPCCPPPVPFCPPVCRPACLPVCVVGGCGGRGCGRKKRDLLRSQRSLLSDKEENADKLGSGEYEGGFDSNTPINDWGYNPAYTGGSISGAYGSYMSGEYSGGGYNLGGFGGGNDGSGYGGYGGQPTDCRIC